MSYEHIPEDIFKLIRNLEKEKRFDHRFLSAINHNEKSVLLALDNLFMEASLITGFTPSQLVKYADFMITDQDSDRFDAMLAELRTIIHLNNSGFNNIKPLKAPKGEKESDFLAYYGQEKWVVEVMCSSAFSDRWTKDQISDYIIKRFKNDGKENQLMSSQKKYSCTNQLLVIVMNSPGGVALNNKNDYINILENVWNKLGFRNGFYLSIITGKTTLGVGIDDSFYSVLRGHFI